MPTAGAGHHRLRRPRARVAHCCRCMRPSRPTATCSSKPELPLSSEYPAMRKIACLGLVPRGAGRHLGTLTNPQMTFMFSVSATAEADLANDLSGLVYSCHHAEAGTSMAPVIEERREIEVYAGQKGHVCIKQDDYKGEEMLVIVHPDDLPRLIDYLREAQAEAYVVTASSVPEVRPDLSSLASQGLTNQARLFGVLHQVGPLAIPAPSGAAPGRPVRRPWTEWVTSTSEAAAVRGPARLQQVHHLRRGATGRGCRSVRRPGSGGAGAPAPAQWPRAAAGRPRAATAAVRRALAEADRLQHLRHPGRVGSLEQQAAAGRRSAPRPGAAARGTPGTRSPGGSRRQCAALHLAQLCPDRHRRG